eukprot:scaffold20005_cov52-Phaeocystis_antarctica.AAC.2
MIGTSDMERSVLGLLGRASLVDFSKVRAAARARGAACGCTRAPPHQALRALPPTRLPDSRPPTLPAAQGAARDQLGLGRAVATGAKGSKGRIVIVARSEISATAVFP